MPMPFDLPQRPKLGISTCLRKHPFNSHPDRHIAQQTYLQPLPAELSLRNAL
ncbi:hypothetical protein D3C85_1684160 [compost metagenome]